MEMKNKEIMTSVEGDKVHVVMLGFPIVGRTNPMVQFGKRLSSKGLLVTLATTSTFASKLSASLGNDSAITIAPLSDQHNDDGLPSDTLSMDDYTERFDKMAPLGLAALIKDLQERKDSHVRCLIYDSAMIWALPLARQLGIYAAPFFPQSCAVSLIFCHVYGRVMSVTSNEQDKDGVLQAPGLPPMAVRDLPSFVQELGKFPLLEKLVLRQFENFHEADWQFFNSFDALEQQVLDWMMKQWPTVKSIGPTIPSMYVDEKEYDAEAASCIQWLDTKEDKSTVYVSFGSLASLGDAQMDELALGLVSAGHPFLWVVRSSEDRERLQSSSELQRAGKIVSWCPQLAVLGHRAVACFFTHCGWNSTLEAISCGVPMVVMPHWADQPTNAMFVEQVWRVGVRVKPTSAGLVTRHEVHACIQEVMQADHIRSNASKFKILAKDAVHQGGSSYANIDYFVAKLLDPTLKKLIIMHPIHHYLPTNPLF